ncbi:MAG: YbjN domain-containing protein [Aureispira sp.]|nr:YbjN domain-containing protein [Aureispira sp.]
MFDILIKYLRRIKIPFTVEAPNSVLYFNINTPEGLWKCTVILDHHTKGLGFYSTLPSTVPPNLRTRVALYLMALNNNRLFGNFELDLKTGDVHFKTYVDCESVGLSERILDRTMLVNITTMQQYLPKLMSLLKGTTQTQLKEAS